MTLTLTQLCRHNFLFLLSKNRTTKVTKHQKNLEMHGNTRVGGEDLQRPFTPSKAATKIPSRFLTPLSCHNRRLSRHTVQGLPQSSQDTHTHFHKSYRKQTLTSIRGIHHVPCTMQQIYSRYIFLAWLQQHGACVCVCYNHGVQCCMLTSSTSSSSNFLVFLEYLQEQTSSLFCSPQRQRDVEGEKHCHRESEGERES